MKLHAVSNISEPVKENQLAVKNKRICVFVIKKKILTFQFSGPSSSSAF